MPRWIKISITCLLFALLAVGMDWHELPASLAQLHWGLAALAMLAIALELPVNASKWWWSLRLHGRELPWRYLFRSGCIAYFLNNFLPSAIGGDVYRIYRTIPAGGEKSAAVSAVLLERIVGLGAMLSYGALAAIGLSQEHELARSYLAIATGGACAAAASFVLFRVVRGGRLATLLGRFPFLEPVARICDTSCGHASNGCR